LKIFLVFLFLVGSLFADRDGGPYIGVGYGVSTYHQDDFYSDFKDDKSSSIILYGGAYINKYLSVEINYVSFDAWNMGKGYEIDDVSSINYSATTINTMAHYPFFDDILDTYIKFGVGQIDASGLNSNGFTLGYGGGIGIRFADIFSMRLAYDRYTFEYRDPASGNYDMYIDYLYTAVEFQF